MTDGRQCHPPHGSQTRFCQTGILQYACGCECCPNLVGQAARTTGAFPEVTHSYPRRGLFDIWFTIIAGDTGRIPHIFSSKSVQRCHSTVHRSSAQLADRAPVQAKFSLRDYRESPGNTLQLRPFVGTTARTSAGLELQASGPPYNSHN
jgi:hypothetical protein